MIKQSPLLDCLKSSPPPWMCPHPGSWSLAVAPLPGWWHKNHSLPDPRGEDTCAKDISVGLHGITALFSHTDGTKHKERLPKDTPISFFKCTEPSSSALLSNDVGNSSEVLSSKQTTISLCTNKQLFTKAESWNYLGFRCGYVQNTRSIQAQIKVNSKEFFLWKNKVWVYCEVWNCTLLCWTIEFPVERRRIFCRINWWIL